MTKKTKLLLLDRQGQENRSDTEETVEFHEQSELLPLPTATTVASTTTLKQVASVDDLNVGVSVLLQLAQSGTITADEGRRRKFLLQTYVAHSIQHGNEEEEDHEEELNSKDCCRCIHHWWRKLFQVIYYTDQVE